MTFNARNMEEHIQADSREDTRKELRGPPALKSHAKREDNKDN